MDKITITKIIVAIVWFFLDLFILPHRKGDIMTFPFLTVFIIFLIWLTIKLRRSANVSKQDMDDFWRKEMTANATVAQDISSLRYLTIPIDKFPLHFSSDSEICAIENELEELSTHKLLNLTGMTNTELKAKYGVPNFDTMSIIGEDFDRLTVLLNSYGKILIDNNMIDEAITVLEYAAGIGTDVSESYILLGNCYKAKSNDTKLEFLKSQVSESNLVLKNKILEKIS